MRLMIARAMLRISSSAWMRYGLGDVHRVLSGNLGFGEVARTGRSVDGVGQLGFYVQAHADDLVG